MKNPFVSIIVPCRKIDSYTIGCIKGCLRLNYDNFELVILPDSFKKKELKEIKDKMLKVVATGKVKPAIKRNLAMRKSGAEIYAFIDSDAYPEKEWLKNAVNYLKDESIGMIGGPNLTPKNASFGEKVSGIILSKWFCSGNAAIRYKIAGKQETLELPSCNFIVKKEYAGKFEPGLLTAEDSRFCFGIWKTGKKIVYAPDVAVYHHRREIFRAHARQMWIYGRDIGLLLKKKGQFSYDKLYYSLLSLFVLGVFSGAIASFFSSMLRTIYFSALSLYLFIVLMSSFDKEIKTFPYVFAGIILTHFAYGSGFLYGLFSKPKNALNKR